MADKKDTLGGLNDAVETLNKDNNNQNIQSSQVLGDISATMQDIYSINSQMLEVMSAIQQSLAPDAFGAAQATETTREEGAPIVGGPAEQSSIEMPPAEKKGFGMMALLGAGAIGALLGAMGAFLDFDADAVKQKVVTLLSIKDELGGNVDMLMDGGAFMLAMGGIGLGLAAFGIGSAVAGGGMALADWVSGGDWAQAVKDSVVTLLSIKDALGGNVDMLMDGGAFMLAMAGVGLGLAAFGAGAFVGGGGLGFAEWAGGSDWSEAIKQHVITLLSIKDALGGNVDMLMDGGAFMLTMAGIGLGLAAFGIGSAAAGLGEAVAKFMSGDNWSETVVEHVKTLTSVTDEVSPEKAEAFSDTMGTMAAGLLKFSGGNFLSSIMDAGAALMNFLTGNESPIDQMMRVADNEEKLNKGADALDRIRGALGSLSALNFDGSDLGLQEFAEDLVKAVPAIEKAIMGGKIEGGFFFGDDVEFKGLASPDIDFESAIARMAALRTALGAASAGAGQPVQSTQPVAQTAVPADTGTGITAGSITAPASTDSEDEPPYSGREKARRAIFFAQMMGFRTAESYTSQGTVPVSVNGQPVPHEFLTDAEIQTINAARSMRADMNSSSANLIPTRQSGENLQTAQAEANENASANGGGNAIVQQNIAPNTINQSANTNIATRTQHHKADDIDLLMGAY